MIAGDPMLIHDLSLVRPSQGIATPHFIQGAAISAWRDEDHVAEQRALYRNKREAILPVLRRKGLEPYGSTATFYLWVHIGSAEDADSLAARLLEHGILVAPGRYFGRCGEGYVRLALVPSVEECQEAAAILERIL
jgi:acetylornithine aminotransferase